MKEEQRLIIQKISPRRAVFGQLSGVLKSFNLMLAKAYEFPVNSVNCYYFTSYKGAGKE